jgi:hypothetical protein
MKANAQAPVEIEESKVEKVSPKPAFIQVEKEFDKPA